MVGRPVLAGLVLVLCARPSLQDCSTKETKAVQTEFQECSQGPFINYVISQCEFALIQTKHGTSNQHAKHLSAVNSEFSFSNYFKCHSYPLGLHIKLKELVRETRTDDSIYDRPPEDRGGVLPAGGGLGVRPGEGHAGAVRGGVQQVPLQPRGQEDQGTADNRTSRNFTVPGEGP